MSEPKQGKDNPFIPKRGKHAKGQELVQAWLYEPYGDKILRQDDPPALPLGSVEPTELSPEPSQHESGADHTAWAGTM